MAYSGRKHQVGAVPAKIQPLTHNHSWHRRPKRRVSTWSRLAGPLWAVNARYPSGATSQTRSSAASADGGKPGPGPPRSLPALGGLGDSGGCRHRDRRGPQRRPPGPAPRTRAHARASRTHTRALAHTHTRVTRTHTHAHTHARTHAHTQPELRDSAVTLAGLTQPSSPSLTLDVRRGLGLHAWLPTPAAPRWPPCPPHHGDRRVRCLPMKPLRHRSRTAARRPRPQAVLIASARTFSAFSLKSKDVAMPVGAHP